MTLIVMPEYPNVKTRIVRIGRILGCLAVFGVAGKGGWAQEMDEKRVEEAEKSEVAQKVTLAEQVLRPLAKVIIIEDVFEESKATNTEIHVDLTHQMMTVTVAGQMAITCPVSTGRRTSPTRPDAHTVQARDPNPVTPGYGHFVDKQGRVLVRGVYQSLDPPPVGAIFVEARTGSALLLGESAPRIIGGHVRSTPCSAGDIIVPEKVALILFRRIANGTKVKVTR